MTSTGSSDRPLPADSLALAELGFDVRDSEPALSESVVSQLRLREADAEALACADVIAAFQYWRRDEVSEATELAHNAVEALEDTNLLLWLVRARSVLSVIMLSQGLHHEGIEHIFETLELAEEIDDRDRLFSLNHNLAAALKDVGDIDRAEQRFAIAETWADPATDDLHFVAFNRADMYLMAGRPHDARAVLQKASHLWADETPNQARGYGLTTQCDVALAVGELEEAQRYLHLARACFDSLGRTERRLTVIEIRLRIAQGRLDEARAGIGELIQEQEDGVLSETYRGGSLDLLRLRVSLAEAEGNYEAAFLLQREASDAEVGLLKRNNNRVNRLLVQQYASELEQRSQQLADRNDELGSVVSELQTSATEALELSFRDFLTGLHNRRHAEQEADRLLAAVRHERRVLSLLVIDVDDFKTVNDEYLHVIGDEVLKRLGELMLCSVRKSDVVCRFGGDEFVILMPSTTLGDAKTFAERLGTTVARDPWGDLADGLRVSITCGAAQASEDSTFESLFAAADAKMLEEKAKRKQGHAESCDARP